MKVKIRGLEPSKHGLSIECHQPPHKVSCRLYGEMAHFRGCSREQDLQGLSRLWGDTVNMEKVPTRGRREGGCSKF